MKKIKITLIALVAITTSTFSQFNVLLNDKPIIAGYEINYKDIKSLTISFSNAKKIPDYTTGKVVLLVKGDDDKGDRLNSWWIQKDGYSALADFLYPTKPVVYPLFSDEKGGSDFTGYFPQNIKQTSAAFDGDTRTRKMRVELTLIFNEKISYDKYGSDIVLVDKFSFTIDIWSKSTAISVAPINASFEFSEDLTFKSIDKDESASGPLTSFGSPESFGIYFNAYSMYVRLIKVSSSQEADINNLKTSFENYMKYTANLCNGEKILKTIPSPDGKEWKELTGFKQGAAAYGNQAQWNLIYLPLDQKTNKDTYQSAVIFDPVSIGSLSGFRFKGLKSSVKCKEGGLLSGFASKTDPEGITIEGNDVLYLLKHPTNPQIILLLNSKSENKESTEAGLLTKMGIFEKFLATLSFN